MVSCVWGARLPAARYRAANEESSGPIGSADPPFRFFKPTIGFLSRGRVKTYNKSYIKHYDSSSFSLVLVLFRNPGAHRYCKTDQIFSNSFDASGVLSDENAIQK